MHIEIVMDTNGRLLSSLTCGRSHLPLAISIGSRGRAGHKSPARLALASHLPGGRLTQSDAPNTKYGV